MLKHIETISRPDGASWERYEASDCKILMTSRGQELLDEQPEVDALISTYLNEAIGRTALVGSVIREFFAEGSNSRIYSVNRELVMKETRAHSMQDMLERLDLISFSIESGSVPRWIDVATHYALIEPQHSDMQYVLMQKVDSGVNVGHILHPDDSSELERKGVIAEFGGPIAPETQDEIRERYHLARKIIDQAVAEQGHAPSELITDWHEGNVLVERLRTPVAGSKHKLWVIDQ